MVLLAWHQSVKMVSVPSYAASSPVTSTQKHDDPPRLRFASQRSHLLCLLGRWCMAGHNILHDSEGWDGERLIWGVGYEGVTLRQWALSGDVPWTASLDLPICALCKSSGRTLPRLGGTLSENIADLHYSSPSRSTISRSSLRSRGGRMRPVRCPFTSHLPQLNADWLVLQSHGSRRAP